MRISLFRLFLMVAGVVLFGLCAIPLRFVRHIGTFTGLGAGASLFLVGLFWPRLLARQRESRTFRFISCAALALASLCFLTALTLTALMVAAARTPPPPDATVIVLGCHVRGERPTVMLRDRIAAAAAYLEAHPGAHAILSGGQGPGEAISEAEAMRRELLKAGIAPERLILEDASRTTRENLALSTALLREHRLPERVVIATDGFHQYRAHFFARKNGLTPGSINAATRWYLLTIYHIRELYGVLDQCVLRRAERASPGAAPTESQ